MLARAKLVFLLSLTAAAPAAPAQGAHQAVTALIPMSDGVLLDATLYLPVPARPGRLPLIVRHHGGGSNKDSPYDVQYLLPAVESGRFAGLMYSARGHGESGGMFDFFGERTTQDFSEVLDWVAQHHGGRVDTDTVGAWGYSQGGGESLLPAAQDPRVKALAVGNTFADLNHALNPNDAFKFSFGTGIFLGAYTATATLVDLPLVLRWGASFYADTEDLATPLLPSTTADLAARSPQTYLPSLADRRLPVFWVASWEDQLFPADHPGRMLPALAAAGAPVHYWFASGGHAAGANFPPEEQAREAAMLAWFEQHLLGEPRGFSNDRQVDYWQRLTGDPRKPGEWQHHQAAAWPVPDARFRALYPRADGALAFERAADAGTALLVNDLATFNVANDALILELAANAPGLGDVLEQLPESEGPLDAVSFTSAPLARPLNAVGAPRVTVAQQSTHLGVQQLSAKVWDLGPDGARLVWRGATSGNHGSQVAFELWPNAHRFEPGHQVVFTLAAVDFPTFKPDTEPWQSTILLDGTRLELPVVEAGRGAAAGAAGASGGPAGAGLLLGLALAATIRRRLSGLPAGRILR